MFTIEEIKQKSVPIARKYGVKKLSLFGSYARGEADEKSDVDFLIERGKIRGLEYVGFILDLEDEFKCHVDVVLEGSNNKEFLSEIKMDEVILYEE